MVDIIDIVEIVDSSIQGSTKPVVCRGSDDQVYYVKTSRARRRGLIAEILSAFIGQHLGLPIPEYAVMRAPPQLAKYSTFVEIDRLSAMPVFGSRQRPDTSEIRTTDLKDVDPVLKAKILLFDWWICNGDRTIRGVIANPNLLWHAVSRQMFVIDHNLALEKFYADNPSDFKHTHAFSDFIQFWNGDFKTKMTALMKAALREVPKLWTEIPSEWTEGDDTLSWENVEELLWRVEEEPDKFWAIQ